MNDSIEATAEGATAPSPRRAPTTLLAAGEDLSRVVQEACEKGMVDADGVRWLTESLWAWERAKGCAGITDAARDVLAERERQVSVEGWTPAHDDTHRDGELASAAGLYAFMADVSPHGIEPPAGWPWDRSWWKPKSQRADLVRAGALILAEIERLDRAAAAGGETT